MHLHNKPLFAASTLAFSLMALAICLQGPALTALGRRFHGPAKDTPLERFAFTINFPILYILSVFFLLVPMLIFYLTLVIGSILGIVASFRFKPKALLAARILSGVGFAICVIDIYLMATAPENIVAVGEYTAYIVVLIRSLSFGAIVLVPIFQKGQRSAQLPKYE